jgi:hypothetical protein
MNYERVQKMQHLMTLVSPLGAIYSIAAIHKSALIFPFMTWFQQREEEESRAINISVKAVMTHSNYTPCFIAA